MFRVSPLKRFSESTESKTSSSLLQTKILTATVGCYVTALGERLGFPAEQVTVGNGGDGLIMEFCMALLDEAYDVIVSNLSFPVYDIYTHIMRADLIKIPLKDFYLDLGSMGEAVTEKTKIVFVCNPNYPTGTIVTASEVDAFMKTIPDQTLGGL